jgi:hypothetical protein
LNVPTGVASGRDVTEIGGSWYENRKREKTRVTDENERRVRAFYEATVSGHRESLRGFQAPHVIYDLPEGMPIRCGHFEGLQDVFERFLTNFYRAFREAIEIGYQTFVSDGGEEFGAVRAVSPNGRPELVIYVENAGDFVVSLFAVEALPSQKVIFNCGKLERRLRQAIPVVRTEDSHV